MGIAQMTPFRQALRAYSNILQTRESVSKIEALVDDVANSISSWREDAIQHVLEVEQIRARKKDVDEYERLGLRLMLDRRSWIDKCVIEKGTWERTQTELLMSVIRHLMDRELIFLDIGSYWGLYSLLAFKQGVQHIYAFDPDPHNFSQLQTQIFLNNAAGTIRTFNLAASDRSHTFEMLDSRDHPEGNRGGVGIVMPGQGNRQTQAVAIDDMLSFSLRTLIIKMDVECNEPAALEGLQNIITNNRVFVQMESYPENYARAKQQCELFGLVKIHQIAHDHYYTNIPTEELDIKEFLGDAFA